MRVLRLLRQVLYVILMTLSVCQLLLLFRLLGQLEVEVVDVSQSHGWGRPTTLPGPSVSSNAGRPASNASPGDPVQPESGSWDSLGCASRIIYPDNFTTERTSRSIDRFMVMSGPGRLGNKMFRYASLIGIAHRNGYESYVFDKDLLVRVFKISHVRPYEDYDLPELGEHSSSQYDNCLEILPRNQSYRLVGYYQSWRYFKNVESEVKWEFRFQDDIMQQVRKFFDSSRFRNRTTVGVHVRLGDMTSKVARRQGYTVASKEYLLRAMAYFRKRYFDALFVVCSNEVGWTKKNIVGGDIVYHHKDAFTDIAVLANCQHSIISTGTYGWWAAWLAGGETIYYSNFPAKNTWLRSQYKKEDYFPPSWIGMGDE
ncbi:galactoside alpha-(1,2)-fucosyltransferase 2-like [Gigantopelta aegis]|uniref:galactoside alpha-(1,2)-fucosyltransferase 2-like n=1 Tax=Gigantopelta aegis TaxID=1735272 RepID=UPI001B888681|nr:galactoside alpha-(1,2)-fucosyltransferase 2-like [Gigantopelta aegis]